MMQQRKSIGVLLRVLSIACLQATAAACGGLPDSEFDSDQVEATENALVTTVQAEKYTNQNGCTKSTVHAGYTGTGFVDYGGNGTWLEWNNIDVPTAGTYLLTFRYAAGSNRPCTAIVNNGASRGSVPFASTSSWKTWRTSPSVSVRLNAGRNTIRVAASTSAGGPNLDSMTLQSSSTPPPPPPQGATCNFSKMVYGTAIGDVRISYNGPIYAMATNPTSGGVDVAQHCLNQVNYYRGLKGLAPYRLEPLTTEQKCCLIAEAKTAVEHGRAHFMAGCLPKSASQASTGGGRGATGTVEASVNWAPRLFYNEGPSGGHYQAMMRPATRGITCSYYAKDRNSHAIFVNWY